MSNTRLLPPEVLARVVLEIRHFPTLRALSVTSKTLSAIACQSLLTLALAQDRCRMRDPGGLVYGFDVLSPSRGNPDDDAPPLDDAQFEGAFRMPRARPTILSDSRPPPSCAAAAAHRHEDAKAASLPVVLWASLQPPALALAFLAAIERADLRHIWAIFLIPSTTCGETRRPWAPSDLPIPPYTMSNALHTAARHGNTDVVRWLLDREHLAVYHRSVLWPHLGSIASPWVMKPVDIPIVPPCLCPSRHADAYSAAVLDVPHDDGSPWVTALHMALAHNQIDTARLLVERGANWATAPFGTRGVTALMVACANGIVPFLDYLIERASSSSFREARQPLAPRPRDFNGRGYSHYLSAAGRGATTRRLERRLEALETRIYADGGGDPQHKSRRLPADGH